MPIPPHPPVSLSKNHSPRGKILKKSEKAGHSKNFFQPDSFDPDITSLILRYLNTHEIGRFSRLNSKVHQLIELAIRPTPLKNLDSSPERVQKFFLSVTRNVKKASPEITPEIIPFPQPLRLNKEGFNLNFAQKRSLDLSILGAALKHLEETQEQERALQALPILVGACLERLSLYQSMTYNQFKLRPTGNQNDFYSLIASVTIEGTFRKMRLESDCVSFQNCYEKIFSKTPRHSKKSISYPDGLGPWELLDLNLHFCLISLLKFLSHKQIHTLEKQTFKEIADFDNPEKVETTFLKNLFLAAKYTGEDTDYNSAEDQLNLFRRRTLHKKALSQKTFRQICKFLETETLDDRQQSLTGHYWRSLYYLDSSKKLIKTGFIYHALNAAQKAYRIASIDSDFLANMHKDLLETFFAERGAGYHTETLKELYGHYN